MLGSAKESGPRPATSIVDVPMTEGSNTIRWTAPGDGSLVPHAGSPLLSSWAVWMASDSVQVPSDGVPRRSGLVTIRRGTEDARY
jgi:hypothetical protein